MKALAVGDPRHVGPYRITGRLGAGGMGVVYLGSSPGGREVAVKVIRPELADEPGFRERFAREASAAQAVSGAFTAAVVGADPHGEAPWLATLYVRGLSLAEAIARHGTLPEWSVCGLGAGLAEALQAIHAAGLIHRDLKPSNVLLAADGPRVIDFGIAMEAGAEALTSTGLIVGTPGFMAPEQFIRRPVGTAADVFCLGAVLAFAATGEGPFGTGSSHAMGYRVVHEEPDLTALPARVRDVVARCLAKDPAARPTVPELLDELAGLVASGPGPDPAPQERDATSGQPRGVTLPLRGALWLPVPLADAVDRADTETVEPPPTADPVPDAEPVPAEPPSPIADTAGAGSPESRNHTISPRPPGSDPSWVRRHRTKLLISCLLLGAIGFLSPRVGAWITDGSESKDISGSGAGAGAGSSPGPSASASRAFECADRSGPLLGSGSSAQKSAVDAWIKAYTATCPEAQVNYNPIGSGAGITEFLAGTTAFTGSDAALKPAESARSKTVCEGGSAINLPMLGSPIAIAYHVPGVDDLVLDAPAIAKIFDSKITKWNDAAIRELNPGVNLPATTIQAFHRSDQSVVNRTLSDYLNASAPAEWPYESGTGWPGSGGLSANGSSGVAAQVKQVAGSIGYFDLSYASASGENLPTVKISTGAAGPVEATTENASEGLGTAAIVGTGKDLALALDYTTKAEGAYPLLYVTYEIVCDKGTYPGALGTLKSFLSYTSSEEGQRTISGMGYAPLPSALTAKVRESVRTIT
ncbi:phosphate ABC transporter substrate-binding protein PstS [Streptomyces sp. 35G-GA-8]|uniref:phosphate ABC transporter substrate-binding protein PstS n=1 Tax=Streptomyces sp. 35G-GA-8 TaxID=2939434 RepID=UPI00201F3968|nr:phosphate ABC transporter substrate-binding protein PstS [Streptomyces sp. 35G-GA-8]MCL7376332.1 phosphate ABC transporter substrate-binding protein PstS [Streptomyces sp. 35G-GA-8]